MSEDKAKANLLEMAQDFEAKGMLAVATVLRTGVARIEELEKEIERIEDIVHDVVDPDRIP